MPGEGPAPKKRKSVTFKPDDCLVEVRYFDKVESQKPHEYENARQMEKGEGRDAFSKKLDIELIATKAWETPLGVFCHEAVYL